MIGLLAAPLVAETQPSVGYLLNGGSSDPRTQRVRDAFRQGLSELGYVEGKNIRLEYRYAEGKLERLPELVTDLVRLGIDVLVVHGDAAVRAARQATQTTAIVVANTGDLVGPGYVQSLARPGGNITGLTSVSPELTAKRLDLLKAVVPRLSRLAALWNPTNQVKVLDFRTMRDAAGGAGVELVSLEVRRVDDLDGAFSAATRKHVAALAVFSDPLIIANRKRIIEFAAKHRLPAMFEEREFVDEGGLIGYGPSTADMHHRAATYVAKILKGSKPADLPVEQPAKFELVINLKPAKALGLTIPPSVLARADEIIE
jgi:putative ABC transport system substrate-binding protein